MYYFGSWITFYSVFYKKKLLEDVETLFIVSYTSLAVIIVARNLLFQTFGILVIFISYLFPHTMIGSPFVWFSVLAFLLEIPYYPSDLVDHVPRLLNKLGQAQCSSLNLPLKSMQLEITSLFNWLYWE